MTKDEALNIAIDYMNERLEEHDAKFQRHPVAEAERNNILADIEAVKEALAQPEQEPVAWMYEVNNAHTCLDLFEPPDDAYDEGTLHPLYTTPPQRKPLTDKQRDAIARQATENDWHDYKIIDAVEAAHGIKGEA